MAAGWQKTLHHSGGASLTTVAIPALTTGATGCWMSVTHRSTALSGVPWKVPRVLPWNVARPPPGAFTPLPVNHASGAPAVAIFQPSLKLGASEVKVTR